MSCWVLNEFRIYAKDQFCAIVFLGKRLQLFNSFLGVFGEWLRVNPSRFERCLDEQIRLRAFACAIGASAMCSMKLVEQCFQLKDSKNAEDYVVLIRQMLDRFDYLKVYNGCYC